MPFHLKPSVAVLIFNSNFSLENVNPPIKGLISIYATIHDSPREAGFETEQKCDIRFYTRV